MEQTILITNSSNGEGSRALAIAELIKRRQQLEAAPVAEVTTNELVGAIQRLHRDHHFYVGQKDDGIFELLYVPSRGAKEQVFSSSDNAVWEERVTKKHRNAFRLTEGALFRLPLDGHEGHLEAFITDWSPFPGAAAIAIHKSHYLANGGAEGADYYFTDHFVRHPLTGDLLPVWVASWVKPQFGTGVVIVNPAHSAADLAFAKQVGIPIRFCLVKSPVSSDPLTWPSPPVIKVGTTTKTGRFDGLSAGEATDRYFDELHKHGFAERYVDKGIDSHAVIFLRRDDSGEIHFCDECGDVQSKTLHSHSACERCGKEYVSVSIERRGILHSLLSVNGASSLELFCPASEIETGLLIARLLSCDLLGHDLSATRFFSFAGVEPGKIEIPKETRQLASMVTAPLGQVAVLKRQVLDQVQAFSARHNELTKHHTNGVPIEQVDHSLQRQFTRTKEHIVSWRINDAFSSLYAAQKQLSKEPSETISNLLPSYFALSYVLAGYEYPDGLRLADAWNTL